MRLDRDGQPIASLNARANTCKSINDLYGLLQGILGDQELSRKEIGCLGDWLSRHLELLHEWPVDVIAGKVAAVLEDGVVTDVELNDLKALLLNALGNPQESDAGVRSTRLVGEDPQAILFDGRTFCFTGKFQYGPRKTCQSMTSVLGGSIRDTVTADLDYLIIGTLASRDWAHTGHGRKIEAVIKNRGKGAQTKIVTEDHWVCCLRQ